jgi:hypothetical protein
MERTEQAKIPDEMIYARQWRGEIKHEHFTDGFDVVITGPSDASYTFNVTRHSIDENDNPLQVIVNLAWKLGIRPIKMIMVDDKQFNYLTNLNDTKVLLDFIEKRRK